MPRMNRKHPLARPKKIQGQITRGKTAPNRLRQADHFLMFYDSGLISRRDGDFENALFVDLGYGAEPLTTLEAAGRLRKLNAALPVLGVEIDPERVQAALPFANENTFFRLGGFNMPLLAGERVRLIRAFNVLRQYEEKDVHSAWAEMAHGVLAGGLLFEGTSNPFGSIWAANVLRRAESLENPWRLEALVFYSNFRLGFNPVEFQTILPKNYIHRMQAGEPIFEFFEAWKAASLESVAMQTFGPQQWFAASAAGLVRRGHSVRLQKKWLNRGWLVWDLMNK